MKFVKKSILLFSSVFICILIYSFTTDSVLSKLKSLSFLLRLVDKYYVEEVELNKIIDGAMHGLLEELDPHSQYIPGEEFERMQEGLVGEFEGIGIEFAILDGYITVISPIPDTPSDRAGLIGGDKIIKINSESAYKITQDEVFNKLRGPKNSSVNVTISRFGLDEPFEVLLIRDKIPIHSITASFIYKNDLPLYESNVGYVKINRFAQNTFEEFKIAVDSLQKSGMENLILDLRDNGGGLMDEAIQIIDLFIDSNDTILFTKGRIYDSNNVFYAHKNIHDKKMPVIVLINRSSASASEIISGSFQDLDRGIVVGETSFGKGLVQKQFILDDGSAARITIARYFTPSGRLIQRNFDDGIDEYYLNLITENREANDSLLSSLPTFKTKAGRVVYGGGGITPDVYISSSLGLTQDTQLLLSDPNRLIFKYAHTIKNNITVSSFDEYMNLISSNNDLVLINNFFNWCKEENESFDLQIHEIEKDWEYIKNRVLAEIASHFWGKDYSYNVLLLEDLQFKEALKSLNQAKKLIN